MALNTIIVGLMLSVLVNAKIVKKDNGEVNELEENTTNIDDVFNGVYAECLVIFSFPCVQRKTLMYLKQLNNMSEVSVVGDYVKFVKLNTSKPDGNKDVDGNSWDNSLEELSPLIDSSEELSPLIDSSEELSPLIDKAIDRFFDNHIIQFSALGRDISIPNNVEGFVGRKKRKGGGGGGMMGGGEGGHFGNKKMMMMAMMCMKMKLMMMLPAMMGIMGMMSFKGMMFSMMSFMVTKMMLLMKILEKKGGAGGSGGGGGIGGDGGWAAGGGGGGGAWMPAGGQDFGGSGGGYDANGQWQSRSILENKKDIVNNEPMISYVAPVVIYKNPNKFYKTIKHDEVIKQSKNGSSIKSRSKRGIIDVLQHSYVYWMNTLLGYNNNRRTTNVQKYKIVNGVKYVYYPYRQQRYKAPKEIQSNKIKHGNEEPSIITAEDFNKGEIVEGGVESRMNRKRLMKMKDTVNETIDDNPWE